jgi:hypothetical protein
LAVLPRSAQHHGHLARRTFASEQQRQEDQLREAVRACFAKDAGAAAIIIASELELTQQIRVLHAFEEATASKKLEPKYLHDLFHHADVNADGTLSR